MHSFRNFFTEKERVMGTVRITLNSVRYPEEVSFSTFVLQSLSKAGFKIILKNCKYKDRDAIKDYFSDRNISVDFKCTRPDLDITDTFFSYSDVFIRNDIKDIESLWKELDKLCIENQLYTRNITRDFIPAFKSNSFFVVTDYCLATQKIYTSNITLRSAKLKGVNLAKSEHRIKSIDVVDATTFRVVEQYNKRLKKFEPLSEDIYFSIL